MTLGQAGAIASLAGALISLLGLAIAIWQIMKLRGETRAAQEASEGTRLLLQRETTSMNLVRVIERIEGLKELHRNEEWPRALDRYPEIRRTLIDIRVRHPQMNDEQRSCLQGVSNIIGQIGRTVEMAATTNPQDEEGQFNQLLSDAQETLSEIESQLSQSN